MQSGVDAMTYQTFTLFVYTALIIEIITFKCGSNSVIWKRTVYHFPTNSIRENIYQFNISTRQSYNLVQDKPHFLSDFHFENIKLDL